MKHETRILIFLCGTAGKSHLALILGMVLWQLSTPALVEAQPLPLQTPQVQSQVSKTSTEPQAVVLSVSGMCDYSQDGITFTRLKEFKGGAVVQTTALNGSVRQLWEHIFQEGTVVRTGKDGQADIFFTQIGTTVRLQADTEIKLEHMARHLQDGRPVMETLLDLRQGRIFTVVRSFIPGCKFEIRNAAGRAVVEGGGKEGRYIVTADGTHVTDKHSDVPLKVIGETGVTIVNPGQQFRAKDGKLLPLNPSETELTLIQFDAFQASVEKLSQLQTPAELPDEE